MRKLFIPATIVAVALTSSMALAAEKPLPVGTETSVTGQVSMWDAKDHLLTLSDGSRYYLPANITKSAEFKKGEMVTVSYEVLGQNIVNGVAKAAE